MSEKLYSKADIYVRDHMLIDFVRNSGIVGPLTELEAIYDLWINWLRLKEGKQFNIGDEIINSHGDTGIITRIEDKNIYAIWDDGSCGCHAISYVNEVYNLTGKNYLDKLNDLLGMKEGSHGEGSKV